MPLELRAALLAGIPLLIMISIGVALLAQGRTDEGRSTIAVGVIVAAVSGGATLYWIDRWSFAKQSIVHVLLMCVTVLPALLMSGWFPLETLVDYLILIGVFFGVGAVLWSVMRFVFRKDIAAKRAAAQASRASGTAG